MSADGGRQAGRKIKRNGLRLRGSNSQQHCGYKRHDTAEEFDCLHPEPLGNISPALVTRHLVGSRLILHWFARFGRVQKPDPSAKTLMWVALPVGIEPTTSPYQGSALPRRIAVMTGGGEFRR